LLARRGSAKDIDGGSSNRSHQFTKFPGSRNQNSIVHAPRESGETALLGNPVAGTLQAL